MRIRVLLPVLCSAELADKALAEYRAAAGAGVEITPACVANGNWDAATQTAFRAFIGTENFEERVDIPGRVIDPPALAYIRENFGA